MCIIIKMNIVHNYTINCLGAE